MFTFYMTLNKRLGRKPPSILERARAVNLRSLISWKTVLRGRFCKFQPTVMLTVLSEYQMFPYKEMANLTIKSVIIKEKQVLLFDQHSSSVVYKVLLKCTLCQFTMGPYWVIVSVGLEYYELVIKQW